MKVTLKYEEGENEDFNMTLRLTLPAKYVEGAAGAVVTQLFHWLVQQHCLRDKMSSPRQWNLNSSEVNKRPISVERQSDRVVTSSRDRAIE